jgi:hypothetical protein
MCRKRTLRENSSMSQGVRLQRKSATRLAYKACFKDLVERNMEPTLGQRRRDENVINKAQLSLLQCNFKYAREGKVGNFFTFIESKKTQNEDSREYLFRR